MKISCGRKNAGAAVLARSNFQSGISRLHSGPGWLKRAAGLLLIGQGEPVDASRTTMSSLVRKRFDPSSAGTLPSASSQKKPRKNCVIASAPYFAFQRRYQVSLANIRTPWVK